MGMLGVQGTNMPNEEAGIETPQLD